MHFLSNFEFGIFRQLKTGFKFCQYGLINQVFDHRLTNQVNNDDGIIAIVLVHRLLGGIVARLVEQEGRHVGREHGGVYHQEEDDPVPHGFEG